MSTDTTAGPAPTRWPRGRRPRHIVAALALSALIGGCAVGEGGMIEMATPPAPAADSALAAMSRGDLGQAEAWAARALRDNPRNPYALLIWGLLSERAGQPAVATEAYAAILELNPTASINLTPMDIEASPRPIVEIAEQRLSRLPPTPVGPGFARVPGVTGPTAMETPQAPASPSAPDAVWENVSGRFETLERLYAQDLITDMEYRDRREDNIGALTPLTEPPPAAGLARPAPRPTAVVGRLRDLARTFERGAISAREHADERATILDALLPADPQVRDQADRTPDSARAVRRHGERLTDALRRGLITPSEYSAERSALAARAGALMPDDPAAAARLLPPARPAGAPEDAAEPGPAAMADGEADTPAPTEAVDASGAPRPLLPTTRPTPPAPVGPPNANREDPATQRFTGVTGAAAASDAEVAETRPIAPGDYVHLASYRSMDSARAGWEALSARYAGLLREMTPHFEEIALPERGTFIRLKAGPVAIPGGPTRLCDRLQAMGQFCEPTPLNP
ncbi:tetratricopeptide repeat protein [Roseospira navarrensis]|uniref:SPOR domain-containing protein n=1 Tax=Roseospira navarrensis TaxID=140058 RepID=A0A7X1ZFT8_9PROT|nr:hypothetical protein [Roseospira navarrensis]MQX37533.1 hypothetical protein [Roseospira navarrensis]